MTEIEPLWNTKETATYLGLHVQTVKLKAERRQIPTAGKIGGRGGWRFRKSSIDRWLDQGRQS